MAGCGIRRIAGSTTSLPWRSVKGLSAAPHGVAPQNYPVFSKPIYNLKGMGVGSRASSRPTTTPAPTSRVISGRPCSRAITSAATWRWSTAQPQWWRHATGVASGGWHFRLLGSACSASHPPSRNGAAPGAAGISRAIRGCSTSRPSAAASSRCICASPISGPISTGLDGSNRSSGFTPRVNGGSTIRRDAPDYSVVLFVPHGFRYRHPPADLAAHHRGDAPGVSSVQITFHEELPPGRHAMPPGGFRVAIVNCWDRAAGYAARGPAASPTSRRRRLRSRSCAAGSRRTG